MDLESGEYRAAVLQEFGVRADGTFDPNYRPVDAGEVPAYSNTRADPGYWPQRLPQAQPSIVNGPIGGRYVLELHTCFAFGLQRLPQAQPSIINGPIGGRYELKLHICFAFGPQRLPQAHPSIVNGPLGGRVY